MNVLEEVQAFVAAKLSSSWQLSSTPFLVENRKDLEYEIRNRLGKQGLVGVVMTPKAQYAGKYEDLFLAWQLDELEVDVIENPPVNRGKPGGFTTGQDAAMRVFDVLCPLSGDSEGQFCPVSYEEGEDSGLIVNRCVMKALVYGETQDAPSADAPVGMKFVKLLDEPPSVQPRDGWMWMDPDGTWKICKGEEVFDLGGDVSAVSAWAEGQLSLKADVSALGELSASLSSKADVSALSGFAGRDEMLSGLSCARGFYDMDVYDAVLSGAPSFNVRVVPKDGGPAAEAKLMRVRGAFYVWQGDAGGGELPSALTLQDTGSWQLQYQGFHSFGEDRAGTFSNIGLSDPRLPAEIGDQYFDFAVWADPSDRIATESELTSTRVSIEQGGSSISADLNAKVVRKDMWAVHGPGRELVLSLDGPYSWSARQDAGYRAFLKWAGQEDQWRLSVDDWASDEWLNVADLSALGQSYELSLDFGEGWTAERPVTLDDRLALQSDLQRKADNSAMAYKRDLLDFKVYEDPLADVSSTVFSVTVRYASSPDYPLFSIQLTHSGGELPQWTWSAGGQSCSITYYGGQYVLVYYGFQDGGGTPHSGSMALQLSAPYWTCRDADSNFAFGVTSYKTQIATQEWVLQQLSALQARLQLHEGA